MVIGFCLLVVVASAVLLKAAVDIDRRFGGASLFSPASFTTLLLLVAFAWRPLLYLVNADRYSVYPEYALTYQPALVIVLIVACMVGIAMFLVGFGSSYPARAAAGLPEWKWRSGWYCVAALVAVLLVTASVIRDLLGSIDVAAILTGRLRRELMANYAGQGPKLFLANNLVTFALVSLLVLVSGKDLARRWKIALLAISAVLVLMSLAYSLITSSRVAIVSSILIPVFVVHHYVRPIPLSIQLIAAGVLVGAIGVFGLLMIGGGELPADGGFALAESVVWRLSGTFDQFELLHIAARTSDQFFLGLTYLQDIVLTYVPRSLFPAKPEVFGTLLLQDTLIPSRFALAGLTATYPVGFFAEAYMNFGPIGFLVVPLFYGVMLRFLAEAGRSPASPFAALFLITLAATIGLLRSLGGQMAATLFLMLVLLIFSRVRFKSAVTSPAGAAA